MKMNIINLKLSKKIPKKHHAYILKTLSELLSEGFSIKQSIEFISVLLHRYREVFTLVQDRLEEGQPLEQGLREIGYSVSIIAQVYYAQKQGRFIEGLYDISIQLDTSSKEKNKFMKVLIYPFILFIFLSFMLLGMRSFILPHIVSFISPQLLEESMGVKFLLNFFAFLPQIFLALISTVLLVVGWVDFYLLKKTVIYRYQTLIKLPLIGKWSRYYATYKFMNQMAYFSRGGYSIQQTIQVLVDHPIDPFMSEIGIILQTHLLQGGELKEIVAEMDIFTAELPLIIYQGELTSQFAQKAKLYSEKIYHELIQDIQKKIGLLQPLMFIFIALLVIAMYLIMMLPMLTMEGL